MFIGRKEELRELNSRYNSSTKEFGVVYGRRRIGKSELLKEFIKNKNGFIFQAKKANDYGNLKSFSYAIDEYLKLPENYVFDSYELALAALKKHVGYKKTVLIIDEYPYIVSQNTSFPSVLQEFVDNMPTNIMVILSGSDISFLKKEINNHSSPLYKRRTFEINLKKLDLSEAKLFVEKFKFEDRLKYLSLMSSYPYYLSSLDTNKSFDENVVSLLFNQYGPFFNLPDQILSNSTNTQDTYNSILEAIAYRKRHIKEIANYIKEDDAKVSKYIATLVESEIVTKNEMFDGNQKSNYYEISDPLLRFWYSFIYENYERILINGEKVYKSLNEQINVFLDKSLEDVTRMYMNELNKNGKLPDIFNPFKEYKVEKSKLNRSIEIDGLTKNEKYLIVLETKNRQSKFSEEMYNHLVESASVFPNKLTRDYYIFSKNGFDKKLKENKYLHLINLKDII